MTHLLAPESKGILQGTPEPCCCQNTPCKSSDLKHTCVISQSSGSEVQDESPGLKSSGPWGGLSGGPPGGHFRCPEPLRPSSQPAAGTFSPSWLHITSPPTAVLKRLWSGVQMHWGTQESLPIVVLSSTTRAESLLS